MESLPIPDLSRFGDRSYLLTVGWVEHSETQLLNARVSKTQHRHRHCLGKHQASEIASKVGMLGKMSI